MANLILTVIAVALVAAITVVAVFYGGHAYNSYHEEAAAVRIMSAGDQIVNAVALYANQEHELPSAISDLVDRNYMMEVPVDESGEVWNVRRGYAVLSLDPDPKYTRYCLIMRQKMGLDAEASCQDAEAAGCSQSSTQAAEGCNKHCLRTCFDPGDRSAWNPYFDRNDPCCIDNSEDVLVMDPVFP